VEDIFTVSEVDSEQVEEIICWLTGYDKEGITYAADNLLFFDKHIDAVSLSEA